MTQICQSQIMGEDCGFCDDLLQKMHATVIFYGFILEHVSKAHPLDKYYVPTMDRLGFV